MKYKLYAKAALLGTIVLMAANPAEISARSFENGLPQIAMARPYEKVVNKRLFTEAGQLEKSLRMIDVTARSESFPAKRSTGSSPLRNCFLESYPHQKLQPMESLSLKEHDSSYLLWPACYRTIQNIQSPYHEPASQFRDDRYHHTDRYGLWIYPDKPYACIHLPF